MQVTVHIGQEAEPKFSDPQETSQELGRQNRAGEKLEPKGQPRGVYGAEVGRSTRHQPVRTRASYRKPSGFPWGGDGGSSVGIRPWRAGEVEKQSLQDDGSHVKHFSNNEERDSTSYSPLP